jgi:hypothetical protein
LVLPRIPGEPKKSGAVHKAEGTQGGGQRWSIHKVRAAIEESEMPTQAESGVIAGVRREIDKAIAEKVTPRFNKLDKSVDALEKVVNEIWDFLKKPATPSPPKS